MIYVTVYIDVVECIFPYIYKRYILIYTFTRPDALCLPALPPDSLLTRGPPSPSRASCSASWCVGGAR